MTARLQTMAAWVDVDTAGIGADRRTRDRWDEFCTRHPVNPLTGGVVRVPCRSTGLALMVRDLLAYYGIAETVLTIGGTP